MAKVLVADDSIAVRKVAERHLTEAGLEVTLAANGEEAVALLSNERPDVIICDVIMPDKSGYDVCSFARAQASLSGTPFLLISGIVNDDVKRQAQSCGANGVLKKPFQGASLKDQVFGLLAKGHDATVAPPHAAAPAPPSPTTVGLSQTAQEQSAALQNVASEIQELKAALAREQQEIVTLHQQLAEANKGQERIQELELALTTERETSAALVEQLSQAEQEAEEAKERERALTLERDQALEATKALSEVESAFAQAKAKQDELSRRLLQIAELCGQ